MAMVITDEVRRMIHNALMDAEAAVRNLKVAEDITKRRNSSEELRAYLVNAYGYCYNVRSYLSGFKLDLPTKRK